MSPSLDRSRFSFRATLQIAEVQCALSTNHEPLTHSLAQWCSGTDNSTPDFTVFVQVDPAGGPSEPSFFRGMAHLVVARYGSNIFLIDLLRASVHAWVTPQVANDAHIWQQKIFPLILGVLGISIDVLPLHCACLVQEARGVLIAGESMAGKSTLAVALAQQGLALLSDDWTYIKADKGEVTAFGLQAPVKLLPDAIRHFPELRRYRPLRTDNGEVAYEVGADSVFRVPVAASCAPSTLVFLQRESHGDVEFIPASCSFVHTYINNSVDRVPRELATQAERRTELIRGLSKLQAWHFRYSGSPHAGAVALKHFLEQTPEVVSR